MKQKKRIESKVNKNLSRIKTGFRIFFFSFYFCSVFFFFLPSLFGNILLLEDLFSLNWKLQFWREKLGNKSLMIFNNYGLHSSYFIFFQYYIWNNNHYLKREGKYGFCFFFVLCNFVIIMRIILNEI